MHQTETIKPGDIVLLTPEYTADPHLQGCLMLVERVTPQGYEGNIRAPWHPDGFLECFAKPEEIEATGGHIALAEVT
jgi:hypothetical protein